MARLLWIGKQRTIKSFRGFFTAMGKETPTERWVAQHSNNVRRSGGLPRHGDQPYSANRGTTPLPMRQSSTASRQVLPVTGAVRGLTFSSALLALTFAK